jgi:flagellar hook protein FlgE
VTINAAGSFSTLTITGNRGAENALSLAGNAFTNVPGAVPLSFQDDPTSNPTGESVFTSFVAYDSLGTPLTVNLTAVLETKADTGNTWRFYAQSGDDTDAQAFDPAALTHPGMLLGTGTITFDNAGQLVGATNTSISVTRANTGATTPLAVQLDFANLTSLTSRGSELVMTEQDGSATGTLNSFSIGADGTITGSFSNGLTRTLGQVALATFNNPEGLVDRGGVMTATPQQLGAGSIRSGALELSNVDLSEEFINLIVASTGFTAASRVISTSDRLLTELLNTSR